MPPPPPPPTIASIIEEANDANMIGFPRSLPNVPNGKRGVPLEEVHNLRTIFWKISRFFGLMVSTPGLLDPVASALAIKLLRLSRFGYVPPSPLLPGRPPPPPIDKTMKVTFSNRTFFSPGFFHTFSTWAAPWQATRNLGRGSVTMVRLEHRFSNETITKSLTWTAWWNLWGTSLLLSQIISDFVIYPLWIRYLVAARVFPRLSPFHLRRRVWDWTRNSKLMA